MLAGLQFKSDFWLANNLALGCYWSMSKATEAAKELARRSVAARKHKWGKKGFRQKMRNWGKLGGRPPKKGKRNGD